MLLPRKSSSSTSRVLAATFLALAAALPALVQSHGSWSHKTQQLLTRRKRSPHQYLSAAGDIDSRLDTVLHQLKGSIPGAIASVEDDIRVANRDKAILGLANFLGMLFGIASRSGGNAQFGQLTTGQQIDVISQTLYGYGYWGPFVFEFEDARLDCDGYDLQKILDEYAFLTDMSHNYGYLDSYSGSSPRDHLNDVNDPLVLQFYAVELNHAMKRAIYCIVSKKGGNQEALEINTLIDLYTQLLTERLGMTNEALDQYHNRV